MTAKELLMKKGVPDSETIRIYSVSGYIKIKDLMQEYAEIYHQLQVKNNGALADVSPRLFYVVAEMEEGVLEQITKGVETYKQAKDYKDRWDGVHPNAFIVASLNEW